MPVVRSHWPVVGPGGVVSFTANGGTLVSVHPTDPALARVALILRWAVPGPPASTTCPPPRTARGLAILWLGGDQQRTARSMVVTSRT